MQLLDSPLTFFSLGANDSASATAFRPGEAPVMRGLRISPEGTAEVEAGSIKLHATAMNSGAQAYGFTKTAFVTAAGAKQWVGFFGDSAYYSTDGWVTQTLIASGLREDYWSLCTVRIGTTNYLLCVNGGTNGYQWDGTNWATISGTFPSGVEEIETFNGRVWLAGHNGPEVRGGRIASITEWTGNFTITVQVQTHDGDADVIGLYSVGPILLASKRQSTAWIDGYGQTDIIVASGAKGLSRSVGLLGRRTMQAAGDQGVVWQSDRGIEFYQPGGQIRLVSTGLKAFFRTLALGDLAANPGLSDAIYLPGRNEYLLAVSAAGTQNDFLIRAHLDLPTPEGGFACTQRTYGSPDGGTLYVDANGSLSFSSDNDRSQVRTNAGSLTLATGTQAGRYVEIDSGGSLSVLTTDYNPAALFIADRAGEENAAPYSAGYDGFVRALDSGAKDNLASDGSGGTALAAKLTGPPILPGAPFTEKWAREIEALIISPSATTITFALEADGSEVDTKTVDVAASVNDQPVKVRVRMSGKGETVRPEVRATTAGLKIASLTTRASLRRRRF